MHRETHQPLHIRAPVPVSPRIIMCVCVCFLPIHSGHQWTYQPGSHRRKVTRDFRPPSFCGACLNFSREKDSAIPFPRRP